MYYAAWLLLIWLLCLLSVFSHELGHALGYRLGAGKALWRVIAGSGPGILRTKKFTFRFIPVGGYFVPEEELDTKKGKLLMLAGGPMVSLLLTALFGAFRFCFPFSRLPGSAPYEILFPAANFLLFFNFFQFLFTSIPMRYRLICKGHESDALQFVHVLKDKQE